MGKLLKIFVAGIKALRSPSKDKCEKGEYAAHAGNSDIDQQKMGRKDKCLWSLGRSTSRSQNSLTAASAFSGPLKTKSVQYAKVEVENVKLGISSEDADKVNLIGKAEHPRLNSELHCGPLSHIDVSNQEWAATKIQAAFRCYLAQRAFRALQALIKLQALARGWIVRKHASTSLRCLQALIKVQAHARGHHVRTSELGQLVQRHLQQIKHQKRKPMEGWVSSMATLQQLQAKAQSKQDGVTKRQRAMVYALSGQLNRSMIKASPLPVVDYEPDKSFWLWIWLERWTAVHPWENAAKEQTKRIKKLERNVHAERSICKSEKCIMNADGPLPSLQSRGTSSATSGNDDMPHLEQAEGETHVDAWKKEEQMQDPADVEWGEDGGARSGFVQVEKLLGNGSAMQMFLPSATPPVQVEKLLGNGSAMQIFLQSPTPPPPPPPMVRRLLPSRLGSLVVKGLPFTLEPPSAQEVKSEPKVVDDMVINTLRFSPIPPASPAPPPPPPPAARRLSQSPSPPVPPSLLPLVTWKVSSSPSALPPLSSPPMEKTTNSLVPIPIQTSSSSQKCPSLGTSVNPCSESSMASNLNHQTSSTSESLPSTLVSNPVMDLSLSRSSPSSVMQSSEGFCANGALESYLATSSENAASITLSMTQEMPHTQVDFPTDPVMSNPCPSGPTFATDMHSPSQPAPFPPSATLAPGLYSASHPTVSNNVVSEEPNSPPHKHAIPCLLPSIQAKGHNDVSNRGCTSGQHAHSKQISSITSVSKELESNVDEGETTIGIMDSGYAVLLNESDSQSALSGSKERNDVPDVSLDDESTETSPNKHLTNPLARHKQLAETGTSSVPNYMATTKSSKAKIRTAAIPRQKPDSPKLKLDSPKQNLDTTKQMLESPKQKPSSPKQKLDSPNQKSLSPNQKPDSTTKRRHSLSASESKKSSPCMQKPSRHVPVGRKSQIAS